MATKVYIAGPYTEGGITTNVKNAMDMWHELHSLGYVPYCPHLSHFLDIEYQLPWEQWLEYDLKWLEVCDVLLRLPGASKGADIETSRALFMEIPVVLSVAELVNRFPRPKGPTS